MSCMVKGCHNKRRNNFQVSFHRFPRGRLEKEWLKALGINEEDWTWSKNKNVCSKHFKPDDLHLSSGKNAVNLNAIPSLFLNNENSIVTSEPSTSTSFMGGTLEISSSSRTTNDSSILMGTSRKRKLNVNAKSSKDLEISGTIKSTDSSTNRNKVKFIKSIHDYSSKDLEKSVTGTSTDSSTKRKRVKFIKCIHNYYSTSPTIAKSKSIQVRKRQQRYHKQLFSAHQKINKLKREVTNLKTVTSFLRDGLFLSENAVDHLERNSESVPHLLMSRYMKNIKNHTITHETYPPALREFAATLQFYSCRAYEEVRQNFNLALPHQATIRKWFKNVDCSPGFVSQAFDALKLKSEEASSVSRELICSLMLDEMSIKKQIEFDNKKIWGYIDVGTHGENDEMEPATEVLVLMVVSHQAHWKIPIAYFFIKSLSGREKANIVQNSLIRLHEIGVRITSVTCDGPSTHFTMMRELGCDFQNAHEMTTSFSHPSNVDMKVHCIFDACHMLKLMRNNWASLGDIIDPEGNIISWTFIKKLHHLKMEENFNIANKIKRAHMEWHKQKMKVSLAAQTLSNSVADALEFLNTEMNMGDFKGCEHTVKFIKKIDILFDILNSRNPYAKGFKAPLKIANEEKWRPIVVETTNYILRCTDITGRPLWMTPKKTPFIGFAISAISICGIFDDIVKTEKLKYLLTYKVSQDHIETFFCSVRSRSGWNNNPTCLQFMRSFRKLLLHSRISGQGGNCRVLDSTTVLSVTSNTVKVPEEIIDVSLHRKYGLDVEPALSDHDYDVIPEFIDLLSSNVVTYIAGYVIKMLERAVKCLDCLSACESSTADVHDDQSFKLIHHKNKGGLRVPSRGVIKICESAEISIRKILYSTDNRIPREENFVNIFVSAVSQKFYSDIYSLFPKLKDHFLLESSAIDQNHGFQLIKHITRAYLKIRLHNLAKKYTEIIQGTLVRRELNKLILFNHQ